MALMFLFSLATIGGALATPKIMGAIGSGDWSEIAGEYPENGTTEEKEEWKQGAVSYTHLRAHET